MSPSSWNSSSWTAKAVPAATISPVIIVSTANAASGRRPRRFGVIARLNTIASSPYTNRSLPMSPALGPLRSGAGPLTAGSIAEVALPVSRPNTLDPGLCGRLLSSVPSRACSLVSNSRPGSKTSRAPRVQGTRGSGPIAWTGGRHGGRNSQRLPYTKRGTPRARAPIMSSSPKHIWAILARSRWRAPVPFFPWSVRARPPAQPLEPRG